MAAADDWIDRYYNKVTYEARLSLDRRDKFTNWALTILAALISIYFGVFSGKIVIPDYWRFLLVISFSIIEIRFFIQSMQSYGFLKKWRHLQKVIEQYWDGQSNDRNYLLSEIRKYDHGNKVPIRISTMIDAQARSGFVLILSIPFALLVNELFFVGATITNSYLFALGALLAYIIWEAWILRQYEAMKYA
jgi:hypothetical protein